LKIDSDIDYKIEHKRMNIPEDYPDIQYYSEIPEDEDIYILTKDNKIVESPGRFYCSSDYCKKKYAYLPKVEMYEYFGIPEGEKVLIIPHIDRDGLLWRVIDSLERFEKFLYISSLLLIDVSEFENDVMVNGFLLSWQKDSIRVWKDNKELLYNTETDDFNKIHIIHDEPQIEQDSEQDSENINDLSITTLNRAISELRKATISVRNANAPATNNNNYQLPAVSKKYKPYSKPCKILEYDVLKTKITQKQVNSVIEMLLSMNLKELLESFAISMFIDIQNCHLMLHSQYCGTICKLFPKIKEYLFYAMRIMFLEEKQKYDMADENDRFLFVMNKKNNSIAGMPTYKFGVNNPYYSNLIANAGIFTRQPIEPCFLRGKRGIYSYKKFMHKLSVYTGDIFRNLDWEKTALCGSTITACLIKNPLKKYFENFSDYINEYYPKFPDNIPKKKTRKNIKKRSLIVDEDEEISCNISEIEGTFTDIDIMIETLTMEEFDKIVKKHFEVIHMNVISGKLTKHLRNIELVKINTENKYKYRITGLPREVEFFHVNSIPGVINKFHLGCVRAYFTGTEIFMFPTFITAAYMGLNVDMRWVSCNKDLRDIVLKYYQRGFGTLLNSREKKLVETHMQNSDKWPSMNNASNVNNRGYWRMRWRRTNNTWLAGVTKKLMNPSISKFGIGYGINQPLVVINPEFTIDLRNYKKRKINESKIRNRKGALLPIIIL
jgi:hypothetical protein